MMFLLKGTAILVIAVAAAGAITGVIWLSEYYLGEQITTALLLVAIFWMTFYLEIVSSMILPVD